MTSMALLFVSAAACVGSTLLFCRARILKSKPLPPGPKPLPLIGNFMDIPTAFEWVTYDEWSKKYNSDILYHEFAGVSTVILTSQKAVNELLEKKGNIYSSRPRMAMLSEVIGAYWAFTLMPYGKEWNERRKLLHRESNAKQVERYEPHTIRAVRNFMRYLVQDPENFHSLLKHMAGSIILSTTYGINVQRGDPVIETAARALDGFIKSAIFGTFWVDYLPALKYIPHWLPGASFKVKGKGWKRDILDMLDRPFETVKRNIKEGKSIPCFVSFCLDGNATVVDPGEKEKIVKEAAGAMYLAGTDTTVTALDSFFLYMVLYPDVQQRAQAELDQVLGTQRLLAFEDKPMLPYICALINEILRYQPVNPLSLPHLVTEEDEYDGYRIPKNAVVLGNVWSLLRDPEVYGPEPSTFNPSRFLTATGELNPDIPEPSAFFGFGRRKCPGSHLAIQTIFATVASILQCFNIVKIEGEDVKEEYESSLQNRPARFRCRSQIRSPQHEKLIMNSSS